MSEEKLKKVIFLDIDGVLNSVQNAVMFNRIADDPESKLSEWNPYKDFCPVAICNLCEILTEHPDLKLVISSTWRIGCNSLEELKAIFNPIGGKTAKLIQDRIIDRTPIHRDSPRGIEIQEWLDKARDEGKLATWFKFLILDDDSDMAHLDRFLIRTNNDTGLLWGDAQKVIRLFKSDFEKRKDKMLDACHKLYIESLGYHKEINELADEIREKVRALEEK